MDHSTMDMGMQQVAAVAGGFDYGLAFMAGVLGSGHCLGMCGALVSGYFMKAGASRTLLPYFFYQFARIFVYTLVGFAAAALGVVLVSSGIFGKFQSILQMSIGFVVIILALGILGWIPFQGSVRLLPMNLLRRGYAESRTKGPLLGATIAGLLNGLMPCPLTFAMAVKATSATTIMEGGLLMLTFGAGTLPTMLFVSVAFGKMSAHFRGLMLKSAALIMIIMGCNTIYMGMSFYVAESFQQHNFIHDIKNEIDAVILFLRLMVDYYAGMIKNIQGQ
ncbi:MAG: sulfite exporter TauE/SafE family protein [Methylococcales bacterium]|nr:sulfite exporter TauE/SafE family protein [Methylococcales bacterium]MDD5633032.1 sulfite exporter TauE/SafE family protein [Methylococcales bacterium]